MKKLVIGLLGESKTGKDWLGQLFKQHLNRNMSEKSLIKSADIIKQEAETRYPGIFDTSVWETSGDDYREEIVESIDMSRRQILQNIGSELIEENPNYVYNYLCDSINATDSELVLVTDLRNALECSAVRDSGGIVIKVTRHLKDRYPKMWKKYSKTLMHEQLGSPTKFKEFLKIENPKLHKKLHHFTETSVEEVSSSLYNFKYENKVKYKGIQDDRSLNSLILKLSAI